MGVSPTLLNVTQGRVEPAFEQPTTSRTRHSTQSLCFVPGHALRQHVGVGHQRPRARTPTRRRSSISKSLQFIDNLTWSRGSHNVKTGLNLHPLHERPGLVVRLRRQLRVHLAGELRAEPPRDLRRAGASVRRLRGAGGRSLIGLYAQDDWSATRNLTLNLGVRYEFITTPNELDGREARMPDLQAANTSPGRADLQEPVAQERRAARRLRLEPDRRRQERAARRRGLLLRADPEQRLPRLRQPHAAVLQHHQPVEPDVPAPADHRRRSRCCGSTWCSTILKNPYRLQYNVTYQRELSGRTVVTAGFIGSRGYDQIRNIEYNQAVPQVLADGSYFFPVGGTRRNPNFGSMRLRTTDGLSWYKGLVVGGNRRFTQGLSMQASYTLGKSEDLGSQAVGSGDFDNSFQPAYGADPMSNKGLSDFDIRHNFVYNSTWELPFGRSLTGRRARALAYGWQLSGILTARSGIPFSPVLGFDRARALPRSGGAGQRPDLVAGLLAQPGARRCRIMYFDPNCFALPAAGTLGNLRAQHHHRAGLHDARTWRSSRTCRSAPGRRLQFRAEGFNVTNHVNFGLPASTVFNSAGRVGNAGPDHHHRRHGAPVPVRGQARILIATAREGG